MPRIEPLSLFRCGTLISEAVRQAWAWGAKRVWVFTNSLSSPHALKNYQARGFTLFDTKRREVEVTHRKLGPW